MGCLIFLRLAHLALAFTLAAMYNPWWLSILVIDSSVNRRS